MTEGDGSAPTIAWSDPAWFAADVDVLGRRVALLRVDPETLERSTFLDTRIAADLRQSLPIPESSLPSSFGNVAPVAWLFHTSFCCSTLLARALHDHPGHVVYREPLVLRRLADAKDQGESLDHWVQTCVDLLGRPWSPVGRIVIKPTHGALNIAAELLAASPGARAVAVTSSLDDFVTSHLKKSRATLEAIPLLCRRVLAASPTARAFPRAALSPPTLLAAAGLQWALQRELLLDVALGHPDRLRIVDMQRVLSSLPDVATAVLGWTNVRHDAAAIRSRAVAVAGSHAKSPARPYSAREREMEAEMLKGAYGAELAAALAWMDAAVLPYMRPDAVTLDTGKLAL